MNNIFIFIIYWIIGYLFLYGLWYILPKRIKGQYYIWSSLRKLRKNLENHEEICEKESKDYTKGKDKYEDECHDRTWENYREKDEFKENIIRVLERYKHDDNIWWKSVIDLKDFANAYETWVDGYKATMVAGVGSLDEARELNVKMYELEERIKKLLNIK